MPFHDLLEQPLSGDTLQTTHTLYALKGVIGANFKIALNRSSCSTSSVAEIHIVFANSPAAPPA